MTAPVLLDLLDIEFTEGDRVVYASTNGIRVGMVGWIKPTGMPGDMLYRVYIDMSEHHGKKGPAQMLAQRVGYEYRKGGYHETYHHFLKV